MTPETTPASTPTPVDSGGSTGEAGPLMSAWRLVAFLVGVAGVSLAAYANIDPDVYWHRILGAEWLARRSVTLGRDPISFRAGSDWHPSAWLTEASYDMVVRRLDLGYPGLYAVRFVVAVAFYTLLARFLLRHTTERLAVLLLAGVGLPVALVLQDRPQTLSLLFCVLLLPSLRRALHTDWLPRWWAVMTFTWLWANVHGLWVLVPALLALLTVTQLKRPAYVGRALTLAGLSVLAASLTPVGPRLLLLPFQVGQAAVGIAEWTPTALRNPNAWGLAFCLGVLLVTGLRGRSLPAKTAVVALVLVAYGLWVHRNAAFASLLLTPILIDLMPGEDNARQILVDRRLGYVMGPLGVLCCVGSFLLHAGIADFQPQRIAAHLESENRPLRVAADFDISGFVREMGGDRVRVAVDGRTDRYGATALASYNDMMSGRQGWMRTFDTVSPDAIVVLQRSALRELLLNRGWSIVLLDGQYALLEPTSVP